MDWTPFAYAITSALAGVILTIAARLVDRFLPDPNGKHPLPGTPNLGNGEDQPGS